MKRKRVEKRSCCADLCKNRKSYVFKWITFEWLYDPLKALAADKICISDRTNSHSEGNWLCSVCIHLCSSHPPEAFSIYITETGIEIEMDIFSAEWQEKVVWYSISGSLDASFMSWSGLVDSLVWHIFWFDIMSFNSLNKFLGSLQVYWFNTDCST